MSEPTLEYEPAPRPPIIPHWQRITAYVLIAAPIIWTAVVPHTYPVQPRFTIALYILIAVAIGAGLYVVRRDRGDVIGWLGLVVWSLLAAGSIAGALF